MVWSRLLCFYALLVNSWGGGGGGAGLVWGGGGGGGGGGAADLHVKVRGMLALLRGVN